MCQYVGVTSLATANSAESPACCDAAVGADDVHLGTDTTDAAVRVLKAIADPVRLRLLRLIAASPEGEACLCDLNGAFEISQPTMSHHLKLLHQAGLLDREKRGVWAYYRVRSATIKELTDLLARFE